MTRAIAVFTVALVFGVATAWVWAWLTFPELTMPFGVAAILSMMVGGYLALKVKGNLVGPVMLVGGAAALVDDVGTAYATYSLQTLTGLPMEHVAAWLGVWTLPIAFASLPLLLVVFPDGRFSGRRRWFIPIFGLWATLLLLGASLVWRIPTSVLTNDAIIGWPEYRALDGTFFVWALLIPAVISLAMRYRHGSEAYRRQVRLPVVAALVVPTTAFVLGRLLSVPDTWLYVIAPCAAPVAIAMAVLRYRLYDIDRIVSRTVSYAVVVGLLGLVFAAGVVWIPSLAGVGESPLLVAGSTLAVAALFNPVRRRVQRWVDRRFNRARYDAERVVEGFSTSLRDRVESDDLVGGWVDVVSATMQPSAIGVWVR